MLGLIRKVYADVKVGELLGTPNVKTRAISSQARDAFLEGSETSGGLESLNNRISAHHLLLASDDIVQTTTCFVAWETRSSKVQRNPFPVMVHVYSAA